MSPRKILEKELKRALGCTDVGVVAWAVALAKEECDGLPSEILLRIDADTLRNAHEVGVPGGGRGLLEAVRRGLNGDPSLGLEVLSSPPRDFQGRLRLEVADVGRPFVAAILRAKTESMAVVLDYSKVFYVGPPKEIDISSFTSAPKPEFGFSDIETFLEELDDYEDLLREAWETNFRLSNGGDRLERTVSAVKNRMAGSRLPAMALAGSGNQGITATLPFEREETRAMAFACFFTIWATAYLGRTSVFCGLHAKVGPGLAGGFALLQGKDPREAVLRFLSGNFGVLCDGAKEGCAMKAASAVLSARFEAAPRYLGGVVGEDPEETMKKLKKITNLFNSHRRKFLEILVKGNEGPRRG